jgi:Na+-driven multidrug efflux pump
MIRVQAFGPLGWDWTQLGQMVRIGLPNAISMVLFPVVYMVLVRIPAAYGDHQVAALRIGHTVEGMSFFLAIGVSQATATLVGQNLGAGKPARAARFAWASAGLVSAVVALFSVAFYFWAEPIAAVFDPQAATVAAGAVYLRILAVSQVFMGLEIVFGGGFNGAGNTGPPTMVAVPLNLARIPLAYWLADSLGWGVAGVWWAISGTSIVKGALMTGLFSLGRWSRQRV